MPWPEVTVEGALGDRQDPSDELTAMSARHTEAELLALQESTMPDDGGLDVPPELLTPSG